MTASLCGCCEPAVSATPIEVENRPGLSAIAYRVGTFAAFRQAMLQAIAGSPELAALRTRRSDDFAVTLLELWAMVADVLTFYQERTANEAFLRTARHRDSVLRLAPMLDYQPGPGVAATVYLAFTLEPEKRVRVPIGLRVQSVPEQQEPPQKFETLETLQADARWNRLRVYPAPVADKPLQAGRREAVVAPGGQNLELVSRLAPGDRLLAYRSGAIEVLRLDALRREEDRLVLAWSQPIQSDWDENTPIRRFDRTFRLFGCNAPASYQAPKSDPTSGLILWETRPLEPKYPGADPASPETETRLYLDRLYEDINPGTGLLVCNVEQDNQEVTVTAVGQGHDVLGPVAETVTFVDVSPSIQPIADRRSVRIFELDGPELPLWHQTYPATIDAPTLYLPGRQVDAQTIEVGRTLDPDGYRPGVSIGVEEIELGRTVLLVDDAHAPISAVIAGAAVVPAAGDTAYLRLDLQPSTDAFRLDTASAVLLGNVAPASHGETVKQEVIGDGDASAAFQRFRLRKKPVTRVPDAGPGGSVSSLSLLVNGALWAEVPSLYGRDGRDRVYTTRVEDDGTLELGFGDGETGARLPSGRGNLIARYRHGLGLAGRVGPQTLRTLLDRPNGLKAVTNPRGSDGGADPESLEDARHNAPARVQTFDRAVSLRDFERLATASGEVAKAAATWAWDGATRVVCLTVAGPEGATFTPAALARIHAGLTARRDPNRGLRVENYARVPVTVSAALSVADDRVAEAVARAGREALLAALSFDALPLGRPLHLSDIVALLQGLTGVEAVDVERFQFKDQEPGYLAYRGATAGPVQDHLRIYPARIQRPAPGAPAVFAPAEQAWVQAPGQDVRIRTIGGLPS